MIEGKTPYKDLDQSQCPKMLFPLFAVLLLMLVVVFATPTRRLAPCSTQVHQGWKACRLYHHHQNMTSSSRDDDEKKKKKKDNVIWKECPPDALLQVKTLPTTALSVLLENEQIPGMEHIRLDNMYFSTNLALLPDISNVGREFYTLIYQLDIPPLMGNDIEDDHSHTWNSYCGSQGEDNDVIQHVVRVTRKTLRFAGINYRATAWLNGIPLVELSDNDNYHQQGEGLHEEIPGMFRRRSYDVTKGGRFLLRIDPPDHPGTGNCTDSSSSCGQGGNHEAAKDGTTPQFMLGWDWCQPMPDRSTGLYGSTTMHYTGTTEILNPAVQTISIHGSDDSCSPWSNTTSCKDYFMKIRFLANIQTIETAVATTIDDINDVVGTLMVQSDWGETWNITVAQNHLDIQREVVVSQPKKKGVRLWWPHGVGMDNESVAHLHIFSFTFVLTNDIVSDTKTIHVGLRTIETFLDSELQGQRFRINGKDIYLVGGNWITTDQALRYSASVERYCDELLLHKHAGLNLIRVWGGGVAETDQFYDCADRIGLLVFQEFWMTGDNNGRWAGNYSWPLEYDSYLFNVKDTVKRLRRHPSLLFYGGCNECAAPRNSSWFPNPPLAIDTGIQSILNRHDPDRFYISSSMGGANKADTFHDETVANNRTYSLAYADGPYGMELPQTFFERNPGFSIKNISIGFQPEIGSVSMPTYDGLLRFLSSDEVEMGFPRRGESNSNNVAWQHHKFQGWTTLLPDNKTYDHVYAYFADDYEVNASEWVAAAHLAATAQYQYLFNGFISHAFRQTTGVIMWKSQSPWPALRGFLYDCYLEISGTLRGVRAALKNPVSIVFDPASWGLRIVNRRIYPLTCNRSSDDEPVRVTYTWITTHGETVLSNDIILTDDIPAMSTKLIGKQGASLIWPRTCTSVCFLFVQLLEGPTSSQAWYWLTDPALGNASNYSELGVLRQRQSGRSELLVRGCIATDTGYTIDAFISVPSDTPDVLFYPTLKLYVDGAQVLPLFDDSETEFVLVPGTSQRRRLMTTRHVNTYNRVHVVMTSWNAPNVHRHVFCHRPDNAITTT